jgi:hypothetical protein
MKVIAYDRFRPGVTLEQINPYLTEEVSNVWRLWKAGLDLNPPYDRTFDRTLPRAGSESESEAVR